MLIGRNNLDIGTYRNNKYVLKVRFILVIYLNNMRLNINGSIFLHKKNKNNDFEENKSNEWFVKCSGFFYTKRPINVKTHIYKVTN